MKYIIEPITEDDGRAVIDILNHYIKSSFAAYPEEEVPYEFFNFFLNMSRGYPFLAAGDGQGRILGFALLRPYSPIPTFSKTAEITCFIAPEYIGMGLGSALQERLLSHAKEMGLNSILAGISSLNSASIAFHKKCGFTECGRFCAVGRKWGRDFDVVWMQKRI